ncbi:NAD-dependent deacetylase [Streptomyces phage Belfort]|uniref:NAD-dependent deacetylase n=1 Tax=Streptomyces phage Belfort TaxID=2801887 RepID=A0A7T7Z9U1_9CAUD|nr:NAD-dependent deacetylase [Streptomyces phage Belfort]
MVKVLFVTGAGISANAGIPTYRDGGSSWKDADLEKKSHASRYGNHLDELWDKHWGPVAKAMGQAEPTQTHRAIAEFQKDNPSIVATQNIDDLHERAGSDNVAHVHGSMVIKCIRCKRSHLETKWFGKGAPVCPHCGKSKTRPDVVLFGEKLDLKMFAALESFAKHDADVIVAVGTSLNVFPAAGLVMDNIAKSVIINKEKTPFDKFACKVYNDDCDSVIDEVLGGLN